MRSIHSESLTTQTISEPHVGAAFNPYAHASYVLACFTLIAVIIGLMVDPVYALFGVVLAFGWAEMDGLCGASHVSSLSPLRFVGRGKSRLWLRAVSAYTVGGMVTAGVVGLLLGMLGNAFVVPKQNLLIATAALSLVMAARELNWLSFPLPQVKRQTHKAWAQQFGFVTGAAMWGAHIGLGFATVITHGGFFITVAFAILLGPLWGMLLMVAYWFGRTLPIWLTPALALPSSKGPQLAAAIFEAQTPIRLVAATGLLCAGLTGVLLAISR